MQKKIAVPMYLKNGKAVTRDGTELCGDGDAVKLAQCYSDNGADELLIFDLSKEDTEHEQNLDAVRAVGRATALPLLCGGNIKRLEDVKKILYAGCRAAILDYALPTNVALTEDASLRFGREKIAVSVDRSEVLKEEKERIGTYVSRVILCGGAQEEQESARMTGTALMPFPECDDKEELLALLAADDICGVCAEAFSGPDSDLTALKHEAKRRGISVNLYESSLRWEEFRLNSDGLLPVVTQDCRTLEVLMVAYMNREAFEKTIETGKMTYWSRSRGELWQKGATSGHLQYVRQLSIDCDNDTLLAKVRQIGAACHTGNRSCFYRDILKKDEVQTNPEKVFEEVYGVIADRREHPKEGSYTNYLFDKGIDKILKKLGEETTEIVIAAKNPNSEELRYEISDFLYHVMVLMCEKGLTWEDITKELANR